MHRRLLLSITALWLALACANQAKAAVTPAELTKAINESKVLGPEYKVAAEIAGAEAIVSTYLNRASQNQDNDCKVDAVLIAKQVFELDADLARVKVLFFNMDRSASRQVAVTAGDVKAFESGQLGKEKLLASIEIRKVESSLKPASGQTTAKSSSTNGTIASSTTPTVKQPANANYELCNERGLAFYYPKTWVRKQQPGNDPDAFVELYNTTTREDAYIDIKVEDANSVEEQLFYDKKYWQEHQYYEYTQAPAFKIGYSRNLPALSQLVASRRRNLREPLKLERHVYFGYPHHIYSLTLYCDNVDFARLNVDLNYLLATVSWSQQAPRK